MPDFFCDHGAYTSALGTTPTWGVPQEGDGSALTPAAASSVASIAFAAVPTAGNFVICGVTFTAPAGVINAASVDAAANALAGLINASATAVGASVAVGVPQLRNLVFARGPAGGAPAGTCQVMMRVGSAALNHAANPNVALSHTFTGSPAIVQFVGGSGGCWGVFVNAAAMGAASSYAAGTYGLLVLSRPLVCVNHLGASVAEPNENDDIFVRTANGYTITLPVNVAAALAAINYSQSIIVDTNTQWTSDSGNGAITLALSGNGANVIMRLAPNTAFRARSIRCLRRGGLRFFWASHINGGELRFNVGGNAGNAGAFLDGVRFEENTTGISPTSFMRLEGSPSHSCVIKNSDWLMPIPRTVWGGAFFDICNGQLSIEGCRYVINITGGADPGAFVRPQAGSNGSIKVIGTSIEGWPFGKVAPVAGVASHNDHMEYLFAGVTGFRLGAYLNLSANSFNVNPTVISYTYTDAGAGQGFRHEYRAGVVDWNPDAAPAYPTLRARLMNGVTPWSIKLDWFANTINAANQLMTPRMGLLNTFATGVRTVAVDALSPALLTRRNAVLRVYYVDTAGNVRSESTLNPTASSITTPALAWNNQAAYPGHTTYRFAVTTDQPVATGTEIVCVFEISRPPAAGLGLQLYVDPEPLIT